MALNDYPRIDDYGDAAAEAAACRAICALFDFSFLECARVAGPGARKLVEAFTGRSMQQLLESKILYAVRIDRRGYALADLSVWRAGVECFEVMSGRREDITDLLANSGPDLRVWDMTRERAVLAVQGPGSLEAMGRLGEVERIERLQYFQFCDCLIAGIPCTVGRLGYTGEPGFEVITARRHKDDLWLALSAHARPAGFIAVDLLRIEAGFVLFRNEFSLRVSPEEAGLGSFRRSAASPRVALISFRAVAKNLRWPWIPPAGLRLPVSSGEIAVTSACESIVAGGILGLGYVSVDTAAEERLYDPTGAFSNIRRTTLPLYDPAKRRPRAPWQ
jgi:aminomethyltransferase